jgi:splicing suppressor protein 51
MAACESCMKSPPEVTLKRCAKCSEAQYCSRDCQKADWKTHKKVCGKGPQPQSAGSGSIPSFTSSRQPDFSASTSLSPPKGLTQPIAKPFTRLDAGTWLHGRPESDVYTLLIDAYRMRMEDNYQFDGDVDEDSVYSGAPDSVAGFRRFLARVEKKKRSLLPDWWSPAKKAECVAFGRRGPESWWPSLECAVEKADITEHYGDARFPMQLRMFAQDVYGRGPGGSDGTMMRKGMAAMESGSTFNGVDMSEMTVLTVDGTTGGITGTGA